jgi:protein ImuA
LSEFLEARPANPVIKTKSATLEGLRRRIEQLERHSPVLSAPADRQPWTLGEPALDGWFGTTGLNTAAVHEIKPMAAGAATEAAQILFCLRLLARRMLSLEASGSPPQRIVWCTSSQTMNECGHLYAPGLISLGLDPKQLIIVEAKRAADVLWAMEEGLRSSSLAAVAGTVRDVALTPARRLALAAEQCRTPCLLMTSAKAPAAAATSTRWRIGCAASARHPHDRDAPGQPSTAVKLERGPHHLTLQLDPVTLEWSHEAHHFHLAAALADRTAAAAKSGRRAA